MRRRELKIEAPELRLDPERIERGVVWDEIFGATGRVEIEIGIGKGRFLLAAAESRPDVHHLGVDWANQFLRIAESRALRRGLSNVRFVRIDARELVRAIPDETVGTFYVFYPDPWPKKRHNKRRFLRADNVEHLARTLTDGGHLHVATDHPDYWEAIEPLLDGHDIFRRLTDFGGAEFPLPVDAPLTNFEAKYNDQGRSRFRASWQRRARGADAG